MFSNKAPTVNMRIHKVITHTLAPRPLASSTSFLVVVKFSTLLEVAVICAMAINEGLPIMQLLIYSSSNKNIWSLVYIYYLIQTLQQ